MTSKDTGLDYVFSVLKESVGPAFADVFKQVGGQKKKVKVGNSSLIFFFCHFFKFTNH